MNIEFDISQTRTCEFGFGRRQGTSNQFVLITIDATVQTAIEREAASALDNILQQSSSSQHFDPAEKYSGYEYLILPLHHELATSLAELHLTDNLADETPQVQHLRAAFCYFYRGTDEDGRRLTALNRPAQLKATLGRQGRYMIWLLDSLRIVDDPLLQLNTGFDILIDSVYVHILRPASFRALANVDQAIAAVVPYNIEIIATSMPYVKWVNIEQYARSHPRAASYLASIRTQRFAEGLDKTALQNLCAGQGIPLDERAGDIMVGDAYIMPFLEVIDRRRYEIGLVPRAPEHYKASSRTRVGGNGT